MTPLHIRIATLEVPRHVYKAIRRAIVARGYGPLPCDEDDPLSPIDMHGIVLIPRPTMRWIGPITLVAAVALYALLCAAAIDIAAVHRAADRRAFQCDTDETWSKQARECIAECPITGCV